MLTIAHYLQWYLKHKQRMVNIKAAKQGKVSKMCTPKRAKTMIEKDDDLQNMHSEFTADPDHFGSLRSKTPIVVTHYFIEVVRMTMSLGWR